MKFQALHNSKHFNTSIHMYIIVAKYINGMETGNILMFVPYYHLSKCCSIKSILIWLGCNTLNKGSESYRDYLVKRLCTYMYM